jgi:hypothetical protein
MKSQITDRPRRYSTDSKPHSRISQQLSVGDIDPKDIGQEHRRLPFTPIFGFRYVSPQTSDIMPGTLGCTLMIDARLVMVQFRLRFRDELTAWM